MRLIRIEGSDDPRLDPFRDIRERDARRAGTFIAEGVVVLDAILHGGLHTLDSVLVSDRRVEGVKEVLARVPPEVPVHVAPHAVMLDIVGFDIHRGLLAVGRRGRLPSLVSASFGDDATVLVLEDLTDVDNVGASFRNGAAFGAEAVVLTDRCADPLYRKSLRVSAGHAARLPFFRAGTSQNALAGLRVLGFSSVALCLDADAIPLKTWERPEGRVALWLGTEGTGLSPAVRWGADHRVRIEMAPGVDSLNVSVAGAVALYALRRDG